MTMLTIEGQLHDLTVAMREATIGDLKDLKRLSRVDGSKGLSVGAINRALNELDDALSTITEDSTFDELDEVILEFFDDLDHLDAFAGMVFLCRRKAGDRISFDDALAVNLSDVQFVPAPDDEEEEADPKGPPTSADGEPAGEA